jgi:hypothetical protein
MKSMKDFKITEIMQDLEVEYKFPIKLVFMLDWVDIGNDIARTYRLRF